MKGKFNSAITIFIAFILCNACTYKANDPNICYSENVLPILSSNCGGCHEDLTNYEGTMKYVKKGHPLMSELYQQIKGPKPKMPPDSHKLTSGQVQIIKAWISMGAQNTSNCTTCDTSYYTFKADIQPILNNWCVDACHNSSVASSGYNLSSYADVDKAATTGRLMGSIKHLTGFYKMPKNTWLTPCQINKIQNWVNAGHLNN